MKPRWRIFTVFAILYCLAYFYRVAMAVLADDFSREMSITPAQLGTLSGAFFYAFAFTQIPLGPLLDRYGGKRIVLLTGIVTTLGVLLFASSHTYSQALAGRILIGAGTASVLMGSLKVFINWFDAQEFGRISGFIIAVGNLGNLAATAPLATVSEIAGWRPAFYAIAFMQAGALILVWHMTQEHPERVGTVPEKPSASRVDGLRNIFFTPSYWLISFSAFTWYASYMAVQGLWGGPYLMEVIGLSKRGAGGILLATSLGFLIGCLFVGDITERVTRSPKRTLVAGQILLVLCMLLFLGPMQYLPRPVLSLVFFFMGLVVSSGVAVYPLVRESFPPGITGTALTLVNFFILLGAATMQQAMGIIIAGFPKTASGAYPAAAYHQAFIVPVALLVVSTLLFLWTRDPRRPGAALFTSQ